MSTLARICLLLLLAGLLSSCSSTGNVYYNVYVGSGANAVSEDVKVTVTSKDSSAVTSAQDVTPATSVTGIPGM